MKTKFSKIAVCLFLAATSMFFYGCDKEDEKISSPSPSTLKKVENKLNETREAAEAAQEAAQKAAEDAENNAKK